MQYGNAIITGKLQPFKQLTITVDELNSLDNLSVDQHINIKIGNESDKVKITRINGRFVTVEVVDGDNMRHFNFNDRIIFNSIFNSSFKSKKVSKSKSKKV